MKGKKDIIIYNNKLKYKFIINRYISIINDISSTGKTTLLNIIKEYNNGNEAIKCDGYKKIVVMDDSNYNDIINNYNGYIIFIDEDNSFYKSRDFSKRLSEGLDNYFVIITRLPLKHIPFSTKEIYRMTNSNKENYLIQKYKDVLYYNTNSIENIIIRNKLYDNNNCIDNNLIWS